MVMSRTSGPVAGAAIEAEGSGGAGVGSQASNSNASMGSLGSRCRAEAWIIPVGALLGAHEGGFWPRTWSFRPPVWGRVPREPGDTGAGAGDVGEG